MCIFCVGTALGDQGFGDALPVNLSPVWKSFRKASGMDDLQVQAYCVQILQYRCPKNPPFLVLESSST